jgi:hypothetical protein
MQVRAYPTGKIGTCGCGRSPTGDCIGWHGLEEGVYREKLAEWELNDLSHRQTESSIRSLQGKQDV